MFIYFSSLLYCPLCFQGSAQIRQWEGFLLFGNFSLFKIPFPGRNSVPPSFVSFFVFYIFSYLLLKSWVAFLGAWYPLTAFRSCFVEFTRRLNALLMNLWGRKCSPRPTPPPSWLLSLLLWFLKFQMNRVFFLMPKTISLYSYNIFYILLLIFYFMVHFTKCFLCTYSLFLSFYFCILIFYFILSFSQILYSCHSPTSHLCVFGFTLISISCFPISFLYFSHLSWVQFFLVWNVIFLCVCPRVLWWKHVSQDSYK